MVEWFVKMIEERKKHSDCSKEKRLRGRLHRDTAKRHGAHKRRA